jgi:hypothetical protein
MAVAGTRRYACSPGRSARDPEPEPSPKGRATATWVDPRYAPHREHREDGDRRVDEEHRARPPARARTSPPPAAARSAPRPPTRALSSVCALVWDSRGGARFAEERDLRRIQNAPNGDAVDDLQATIIQGPREERRAEPSRDSRGARRSAGGGGREPTQERLAEPEGRGPRPRRRSAIDTPVPQRGSPSSFTYTAK